MMYEAIKYCDIFGAKFSFYTDEKPRFYSLLGGILSLLLIVVCIIVFIFYELDDFKRDTPFVTTSFIPSNLYRKIKFGEEKIWVPWRIADYDNKYINHKNLIYPIITYHSRVRNDTNSYFNFETKKLNYKLCNETSMINIPEFYKIKIPLDQLFCIDMEDLEMGGSFMSLFINYVTIDFYLCEDGIDYNDKNTKCTTRKDIINKIGYNNSLHIEYYYPVVQFQPTNIKYPIIVSYKKHYYYISKYTNKIDRLYIREYLLKDDLGWFKKNSKNSSYWGFYEINGDSYVTTAESDLFNEESTSRFYSLNIYLQPGILYFERKYKKIMQIIIEGLPTIFVVFKIFKAIAKTFKFSEENKKLFELLFENIKEKKSKFEQYRRSFYKKQNKIEKQNNISDNQLENPSFYHIPNRNTINSSFKDGSKFNILSPFNRDNNYLKTFQKNKLESPKQNRKKKLSKSNRRSTFLNSNYNNLIREVKEIKEDKPINKIEPSLNNSYKISKLFPYKYYFYSIFIKNIDISKLMCCFSKKFANVYKFLGRMFDISSYLNVFREFDILKNWVLEVKDVYRIERPSKINVSEKEFIRNMKECLNNRNFSIFSQNALKKLK